MTNEEKMLDILAGMQSSMLDMRNDMNTMAQSMESMDNRTTKLEFKIETNVETKLDALADGHSAILEQLTPRCRIDDMEDEIRFLKRIVIGMEDEIEKLKAV